MHVETVNVNVGVRPLDPTPKSDGHHGHLEVPRLCPVEVSGVNLRGDDQADRTVYGGPHKAVYVYALEDTAWWEGELGRRLGPGAFGETLSLRGVDVNGARIGERWAIGSTVLEVRQPRLPCFKLGLRHSDPLIPRRFAHAGRPRPGASGRWGKPIGSRSTHVLEQFQCVAAGDAQARALDSRRTRRVARGSGMLYRAERPYRGATEVTVSAGPINIDVDALALTSCPSSAAGQPSSARSSLRSSAALQQGERKSGYGICKR